MASTPMNICLRQSRPGYRLYGSCSGDVFKRRFAPARSMATEAQMPATMASDSVFAVPTPRSPHTPAGPVLTTIYSFPSLEPLRFDQYPPSHLNLPLRRDILHRAVIYEGDKTRQGTASTKWRDEIHGSGRKMRPQKGTGMARIGDKKSPSIKGGGIAFGPKPRDFSTKLPRKMYDLAWRTALSYRYRKGELIVVEDDLDIESAESSYLRSVLNAHRWGHADGRCLMVTDSPRGNLFEAFEAAGEHGRALTRDDVDVKNLLELGRVVIEKAALDGILRDHESDLVKRQHRTRVPA